ncbi:hypothetical protein N878_26390 [Pseudomonas sp. EGD-AK9]|nr:hypothetical protein N878_26390 [Pseudomonas sp. EGD-AK9]
MLVMKAARGGDNDKLNGRVICDFLKLMYNLSIWKVPFHFFCPRCHDFADLIFIQNIQQRPVKNRTGQSVS